MSVVKLRGKSESIQLTSEEALEEALGSSFKANETLILLYNKEENSYEFWQGGSLSCERMLWHTEKFKLALLENKIFELD